MTQCLVGQETEATKCLRQKSNSLIYQWKEKLNPGYSVFLEEVRRAWRLEWQNWKQTCTSRYLLCYQYIGFIRQFCFPYHSFSTVKWKRFMGCNFDSLILKIVFLKYQLWKSIHSKYMLGSYDAHNIIFVFIKSQSSVTLLLCSECVPQNSYVDILTPKVMMVFAGGGLGGV